MSVLENLKKETVIKKLKELLSKGKVSTLLVVPRSAVDGLDRNSKEYLKAIQSARTPAYITKENLWMYPSEIYPEGHYVLSNSIFYLDDRDEFKIVSPENISKQFSCVDLNVYNIHDAVKEQLGLKNIDIPLIDKKFIGNILRYSRMDENEIQALIKAMDNEERKREVEEVKKEEDVEPTTPLHDAVIYPENGLRKPSERSRPEESTIQHTPSSQSTNREESYTPAPIPVNRELEKKVVIATAAIIANRMYEDGKDTITITELQNITDNARYLNEDQKAAAQYLADRMSEANLDNLSLEQLKDYANDIEVHGGSIITDVSVEIKNEKEDEKSLFDEINDKEYAPFKPSDLNYGDKYDRERTRDNENN